MVLTLPTNLINNECYDYEEEKKLIGKYLELKAKQEKMKNIHL